MNTATVAKRVAPWAIAAVVVGGYQYMVSGAPKEQVIEYSAEEQKALNKGVKGSQLLPVPPPKSRT